MISQIHPYVARLCPSSAPCKPSGTEPWYPNAQIASITRMIPAVISTTAENVSQPECFAAVAFR